VWVVDGEVVNTDACELENVADVHRTEDNIARALGLARDILRVHHAVLKMSVRA